MKNKKVHPQIYIIKLKPKKLSKVTFSLFWKKYLKSILILEEDKTLFPNTNNKQGKKRRLNKPLGGKKFQFSAQFRFAEQNFWEKTGERVNKVSPSCRKKSFIEKVFS